MPHLMLHVPKSGGCTVHHIAARQYRVKIIGNKPENTVEAFAALPQAERDGFTYVGGHFSYGFHELFTRPCRYITMLREPVDQMISLYHYIRRCETQPNHMAVEGENITFEQWLSRNRDGHIDNHQVRCLLGIFDGTVDSSHLAKARYLLTNKLAAFGLMDAFDHSLLLFQDALGWSDPYYEPINVYRRAGDDDVRTPAAMKLIEEGHALDIELYRFAGDVFVGRVDKLLNGVRIKHFRAENEKWRASNRGLVEALP